MPSFQIVKYGKTTKEYLFHILVSIKPYCPLLLWHKPFIVIIIGEVLFRLFT